MMSHSTRREFLKTVGGMGLVFGTPSLWADQSFAAQLASAPGDLPLASSVRLVPEFSARNFQQPEAALWPGYLWHWNAPICAMR